MSSISSFDYKQMKARIAHPHGRGVAAVLASSTEALDSLPSEKLAQGLDEAAPYRVSASLQGEIENLHDPFERWLKLNADAFLYIHSRPDRETTTALGVPDFTVIGFGGKTAFVEFKAREHPEQWKKREWKQEQWAATCCVFGIPYLVTNDLQSACQFVKKHLSAAGERLAPPPAP